MRVGIMVEGQMEANIRSKRGYKGIVIRMRGEGENIGFLKLVGYTGYDVLFVVVSLDVAIPVSV
jgi:hypothetical protein